MVTSICYHDKRMILVTLHGFHNTHLHGQLFVRMAATQLINRDLNPVTFVKRMRVKPPVIVALWILERGTAFPNLAGYWV